MPESSKDDNIYSYVYIIDKKYENSSFIDISLARRGFIMQKIADMHCHILPGVDDGAKSMDMAMDLLKTEYDQGVHAAILTPHYRKRMFETDEPSVRTQFEYLCRSVNAAIPGMKLYLGCELHASMDMVEMIRKRNQFCMAGTYYVLVEFSTGDSKSYIRERLYQLLSAGYKPIIAHAERYKSVMGDLDFAEELADMGALIQVNADSIIGKDGRKVKKFCLKLMRYDLLDFVGSDAHNLSDRPPRLAECAAYIGKKMGEEYRDKIMLQNPLKIINAMGETGE